MTATILLVRHAAHGQLGTILSGRTPGIALSEVGRAQARALAAVLAGVEVAAVQSSSVDRAHQTATAIAATHGREVETVAALNEIDFGEWTGQRFDMLDADPRWRDWNDDRDRARCPGGETMVEAQARAWAHVAATAAARPGQTIVMVTHCDIVRAVVTHVLGLPLQGVHRFAVDPASVTRLVVGGWGATLRSLNERAPAVVAA